MEDFNAVNDAQDEVVDVPEYSEASEAAQTAGDAASPHQSIQTNAAFARLRREKEAAQRRADELAALSDREQSLREMEEQFCFKRDLDEIKKAYPSERADSVQTLGTLFMQLRAAGVDNLTAYAAAQEVSKSRTPPEIGAVGGDSCKENSLYTSAELDRLSAADMQDERVYKKAMKSLLKLR